MPQVKIMGMRCNHCVGSVTTALSAIPGITKVEVNLEAGVARYEESSPVDPALIKQAITKIGFETE